MEVSHHRFQPCQQEQLGLGFPGQGRLLLPCSGQGWEQVTGKHSGEKANSCGLHCAACDEQGPAGGFVTYSSPVSLVPGCLPAEGPEELGYIYLLGMVW